MMNVKFKYCVSLVILILVLSNSYASYSKSADNKIQGKIAVPSCLQACAATDFTTRVYDATFIFIEPNAGKSLIRMVSDGKGHIRGELTWMNVIMRLSKCH
jgi:hypothetical protein